MPTAFRLADILAAKDISQSELSRLSGVSFATINRMCRNQTQGAELQVLDKLADALGVAPGDLIAKESAKKGKR